MNIDSENLLLLSSRLGIPNRRPLSQAQLRILIQRMRLVDLMDTKFSPKELAALGIEEKLAEQIMVLMKDRSVLYRYLAEGERHHCFPLTIMDAGYPTQLRRRLGDDAPACLWLRGDNSVIDMPSVACVGSRDLRADNQLFAAETGRRAAEAGTAIVSGNARGADITSQEACLRAGGSVISIVSDMLTQHPVREHALYISQDGWDEPFSAYRALHRNCSIHSFGSMTFAAQCTYGKGGTWSGCLKNLKKHWTPLFCYRDGSQAFLEFEQRGAVLIDLCDLKDMTSFSSEQLCMY